jgi:hypothetical protein
MNSQSTSRNTAVVVTGVFLSATDGKLADKIADFVLDQIIDWYIPDSATSNGASGLADLEWNNILKLLGPLSCRLKNVQLELKGSHLVRSTDGAAIEGWALGYGYGDKLSQCRQQVEQMIGEHFGLPSDDDSDDEVL